MLGSAVLDGGRELRWAMRFWYFWHFGKILVFESLEHSSQPATGLRLCEGDCPHRGFYSFIYTGDFSVSRD